MPFRLQLPIWKLLLSLLKVENDRLQKVPEIIIGIPNGDDFSISCTYDFVVMIVVIFR